MIALLRCTNPKYRQNTAPVCTSLFSQQRVSYVWFSTKRSTERFPIWIRSIIKASKQVHTNNRLTNEAGCSSGAFFVDRSELSSEVLQRTRCICTAYCIWTPLELEESWLSFFPRKRTNCSWMLADKASSLRWVSECKGQDASVKSWNRACNLRDMFKFLTAQEEA